MAIAIIIIVVLVLAGVVVLVTAGRSQGSTRGMLSRETKSRDSGSASVEVATVDEGAGRDRSDDTREQLGGVAVKTEAAVATYEPVSEEELGITRRQFFNRSIIAATALGLASFGAGVLAFLWPSSSGGFGGLVKTGQSLDEILVGVAETRAPAYFAEARAYVNPYPAEDVEAAVNAGYPDAVVANLEEGFIVQYQKCPHLGCRVPWCETSQWFECPCHGSKYNRAGEKRDGPAPRGMTLWRGEVGDDGQLTIDTSTEFPGLPIGTDTTEQKQEGPSCI